MVCFFALNAILKCTSFPFRERVLTNHPYPCLYKYTDFNPEETARLMVKKLSNDLASVVRFRMSAWQKPHGNACYAGKP